MQEDGFIQDVNGDDDLTKDIFRLSSTRADAVSNRQRREWMDKLDQQLCSDPETRQALAEWKNYPCPSKRGYGRLAHLFVTALVASSKNDACLLDFWEGLTFCIARASIDLEKKLVIWSKQLAKCEHLHLGLLETLADINASNASMEHVIPSLVLGALIQQHRVSEKSPSNGDASWLERLLSFSLHHFCPVDVAKAWLGNGSVSTQTWSDTILPALLVKLKSHPDQALSVIPSWLNASGPSILPLPTEEWRAAVLKQLQSNKVENRSMAHLLVQSWASSTGVKGATTWAEALSQAKSALAPARLDLFHCLTELTSATHKKTEQDKVTVTISKSFVEGLISLASKETALKAESWSAPIAWFVFLRSNKVSLDFDSLEHTHLIAEALANACLKQTDLVIHLLTSLGHACSMFGLHQEVATEMWKVSAWSKAMQNIVETTKSKKPEPALLSLYWSLLYYSSQQESLPAWIIKVLNNSSSFLYAGNFGSNFGILAHCLAMANSKIGSSFFAQKQETRKALAQCLTAHALNKEQDVILNSLNQVLQSAGSSLNKVVLGLIDEMWDRAEAISSEKEALLKQENSSRQARESESRPVSHTHTAVSWNLVRKAAHVLLPHAVSQEKVWILSHAGSSLHVGRPQRKGLVQLATAHLVELELDGFVERLLHLEGTSDFGHRATLSLWSTIEQVSKVALNDNEAQEGSKDSIPARAAKVAQDLMHSVAKSVTSTLEETLNAIYGLTVRDIALFQSQDGIPFRVEKESDFINKKKRMTEEEEWEEQLKKELAAKKKINTESSELSDSFVLSPEDKALVEEQRVERNRYRDLFERLRRLFQSIQQIVISDIEVGNSTLPLLSKPVLTAAVMVCPGMNSLATYRFQAYEVLKAMATCVYEIDDKFASDIAQALLISCRSTVPSSLEVVALPSPCTHAATVLKELEEWGDSLSGGSFAFIFPILRAALSGPRTPPGCESALLVLGRHTAILNDPIVHGLRKEMAVSVLELLSHDRAQAFQQPSPFDVLVDCYRTDESDNSGYKITTAELAPLLDDRGALGPKNCRVASMMALGEVASAHGKLVKQNPLAENRVWLNCFADDEEVRSQARKTWRTMHEVEDEAVLSPPSALYAAPLLPLLSCNDTTIADAAAKAFAHALAQHTNSQTRNLENLCKAYIDAYPTIGKFKEQKGLPDARPVSVASVPKKKPIAASLPKKKAAPKPPAGLASIGKPNIGTKKKASSAATKALLKPKEERKLDKDEIDFQFLAEASNSEEQKDTPARVATRLGVLRTLTATTIQSSSMTMEQETLRQITSFLVAFGIAEVDETVKTAARNTFRDIIATYGGSDEAVAFLLPQLEAVLKSGVADETALGSLPSAKVPRDIPAQDRRKEGAVVALGSVALYLKGPENEDKVDSTVDMLLSALKTPSEDVQASVADALSKLMKKGRTQERIESIVSGLLRDCLHGNSLASRRGGAYGLSAAVKGSGIGTLKKLDVVKTLEEAFESGTSNNKEGALFAIELLSSRLGLLFEPYVIVLLPSLLTSFSDGSDFVRKAASHTAGLIMSKLSAHGVKLVTPAVLGAFDDPAWRTKQASIHMLGAMSHLAPKQLAAALPKIVPKLSEAFGDTHPKVRASAQEALDEISTVIRNPEIKSISRVLLKALTDPADNTQPALEKLIGTEFLHSIDAPSLALIVPILHRGLRDRGATVKRMGGLITGNICTMINDPRDFIPYIPTLLPDLQVSLLDPIPDVRSTAAKALGSLARNLGDQILPELRPWLVKKLRDGSCSSAERSGAAQGLTEVLIASGTETVDEAMRNELLPLRSHPEPSTREGVLWMLSFLPPALGQGFTVLIDASLPALVGGLSDENELVRDVAMRAGRVLIRSHGKVHVDKILPSLEVGLGDDDNRIRVASLSLLGDLLSMIGGTTVVRGDGDTQDDIRKAEKAQAQIALVLGADTRKRVLSELYLARSDAVYLVRQNALQVWKTVVSVTARTLRDILSVLVSRIIENLASGHQERTVAAAQCLGDIVTRLSDSVLPQIIPVLRDTLQNGDEKTKLGVCVGLNEVIKCSTKEQITKYIEIIVKLVQEALSNDNEDVRKMAASSFQSLHAIVGSRAFDEVVPSLMVSLEFDEDEDSRARALNGLTGILGVRSRELLPYIIPRLVQKPISTNHAQALAGVVAATGGSIFHHFSQIIPAILGDLSESQADDDSIRIEHLRDAMRSICLHVEEAGVNILISEIASKCASDKAAMRRESCLVFEMLTNERAEKQDFYDNIPIMLRELLYRLNDDDASVLKATNAAFTALSKHVAAEELVKHVEFMRNLLASMVSDARRRKGGVGDGEFLLPGFNMPKGLDPLLPIYQRGILYGTPAIREVSAAGLGEVLSVTGSKFLAGPLIVKMTGPLLRIVGDRNPSNVKVAILKTLGLILVKGGPALRAFVPQFQTTFVKNLSDPSRLVRVEAISALTLLMPLSARVDPLIKELVSGSLGKTVAAEGAGAVAVQTATLEALTAVLENGGAKAKLPATIPSALDSSKQLMNHPDQGVREGAAKVVGASSALLGPEATREILDDDILRADPGSTEAIHGMLCSIRRILASPVGAEISDEALKAKAFAVKYIGHESNVVREAALIALGAAIGRSADPKDSLRESEIYFLDVIESTHEPMEIHRAAATGLAVALQMIDGDVRVDFLGLKVLDACLKIALNGSQRVQFAFNDVLWLALDAEKGDAGLNIYCGLAVFDNQRSMKSLYSKVLNRIKQVTYV
ncbi:hypothetical protein ACA910_012947 [Epithemia clementina (nom. ined.)]